jgi:hypothetical protein
MTIDNIHPDDITTLERLGILHEGHIDRHSLAYLVTTTPMADWRTSELQLMLSCVDEWDQATEASRSRRLILAELARRMR